MLQPLPIDLAGQRPLPERTAAVSTALATLDAAKPRHAHGTPPRNPNSRFLRGLIASFKPPRREASPSPFAERAIAEQGGEVGRAPPSPIPA